MRRIVLWLLSTVTVVVLLFGYHTSTNSGADSASEPRPSSAATGAADLRPSGDPSSAHGSGLERLGLQRERDGSSGSDGLVRRDQDLHRRRGPDAVGAGAGGDHRDDGTITDVDVLQYPNGNGRDQEINDYALPVLIQETLDAQSAKIDMVSGATVTSDGLPRVAAVRARPGGAVKLTLATERSAAVPRDGSSST